MPIHQRVVPVDVAKLSSGVLVNRFIKIHFCKVRALRNLLLSFITLYSCFVKGVNKFFETAEKPADGASFIFVIKKRTIVIMCEVIF